MLTYKVVPGAESGFMVEITNETIRQTMLGFDTEADARLWIKADQAHDRAYPLISLDAGKTFYLSSMADD